MGSGVKGRLYPGRLFDSNPAAMARGQRKIRARTRHWRQLRREVVRPAIPAGLEPLEVAEAAARLSKRDAKLIATGRRSTLNRRRRRHGARPR